VQLGEHVDSSTLLVLSHVINELPPNELARLLRAIRLACSSDGHCQV